MQGAAADMLAVSGATAEPHTAFRANETLHALQLYRFHV